MVLIQVEEPHRVDGESRDMMGEQDTTIGKQLGSEINISGLKLIFGNQEPSIRRWDRMENTQTYANPGVSLREQLLFLTT